MHIPCDGPIYWPIDDSRATRTANIIVANSNYVMRANTCILLRMRALRYCACTKIIPRRGRFRVARNVLRCVWIFSVYSLLVEFMLDLTSTVRSRSQARRRGSAT